MCVQFFGVVFLTLSWVVGGVVVPSLVGARSDDPAHPMPAARRRLWVISGAGGSAAGGAVGLDLETLAGVVFRRPAESHLDHDDLLLPYIYISSQRLLLR